MQLSLGQAANEILNSLHCYSLRGQGIVTSQALGVVANRPGLIVVEPDKAPDPELH